MCGSVTVFPTRRSSDLGVDGEGFGALLDRPEVVVARMSEEHGILDLTRTAWRPRVGEQVRIVPNHVCIVVHLNDKINGDRKRTRLQSRRRVNTYEVFFV